MELAVLALLGSAIWFYLAGQYYLKMLGFVDPNILQNQQQRFTARLYDGGYSKEAKESEEKAKKIGMMNFSKPLPGSYFKWELPDDNQCDDVANKRKWIHLYQ